MKDEVLAEAKATLIDLMKCRGEISVDEGADELGFARSTVRQHLTVLEAQGFVQTRRERHGRGRPRKLYSLTDKSLQFFADRNGDFLRDFLRFLVERDHVDLIEAFIEECWKEVAKTFEAEQPSPTARLDHVVDFMRRRGFMPRLESTEEGFILELCHCPYGDVVDVTHKICEAEQRLMQQLVQQEVTRDSHIATGDPVCRYCPKQC